MELAISYSLDKSKYTYSTLLLILMQLPIQKIIAPVSEIVLIDSVVVKIRI